jgi:hypothetical protein
MAEADRKKKLSSITSRSLRSYKQEDAALKRLQEWYIRRPGEIDKELQKLETEYPVKLNEFSDNIGQAESVKETQSAQLEEVPVEPEYFKSLSFGLYLRKVFSIQH